MSVLNPDYRDMVECLQAEGVEFMLVGGYAVMLHGWPRTTFDIDFWILANSENAAAVLWAVARFGAPLQGLSAEDFRKPGMVFQIGCEPQRIDILSAVDGLDYADAATRAVTMAVDGLSVRVLSLDDLIVNKRASGRPKDAADAAMLEKIRERCHGYDEGEDDDVEGGGRGVLPEPDGRRARGGARRPEPPRTAGARLSGIAPRPFAGPWAREAEGRAGPCVRRSSWPGTNGGPRARQSARTCAVWGWTRLRTAKPTTVRRGAGFGGKRVPADLMIALAASNRKSHTQDGEYGIMTSIREIR